MPAGEVPRPSARPSSAASVLSRAGGAYAEDGAEEVEEEDWAKSELVSQIKQIQRENPDGKAAWWKYADSFKTGNRDPQKHTAQFLRTFIDCHERGEQPPQLPRSGGQHGGFRQGGGNGHHAAPMSSHVLKLRGLPFTCKAIDVADFLAEYEVDDSQVGLAFKDGRVTGEAFVTLHSEELAERALQEKHMAKIGTRYVEIFRSNAEERDYYTGNSAVSKPVLNSSTLRLRGLPFTCKAREVADFLAAYGVQTDDVAMGFGEDGRPSGEAFVTFGIPEDADRAEEELQHAQLGNRYVELFKASYDDWKNAMANRGGGSRGSSGGAIGMSMRGAPGGWNEGAKGGYGPSFGPIGAGKGFDKGFGGRDAGPYGGQGGRGYSPHGGDDFEGLVSQVKRIQKSGDEEKQKWWGYCDSHGMHNYDPARHTAAFLQGFLHQYQTAGRNGSGRPDRPDYENMEDDGRVVRLRGLPFSATIPEITQFLAGFDVEERQVTLDHGQDGRPTGEAFAIFPTEEQASQAMQELQRAQMGSRYIELFSAGYAEWGRAFDRSSHATPPRGRRGNDKIDPSTGDSELDELVSRVKSIQRTSVEMKQKWWAYCDKSNVSGYDPKRHSVQLLRDFLEEFDDGAL